MKETFLFLLTASSILICLMGLFGPPQCINGELMNGLTGMIVPFVGGLLSGVLILVIVLVNKS